MNIENKQYITIVENSKLNDIIRQLSLGLVSLNISDASNLLLTNSLNQNVCILLFHTDFDSRIIINNSIISTVTPLETIFTFFKSKFEISQVECELLSFVVAYYDSEIKTIKLCSLEELKSLQLLSELLDGDTKESNSWNLISFEEDTITNKVIELFSNIPNDIGTSETLFAPDSL